MRRLRIHTGAIFALACALAVGCTEPTGQDISPSTVPAADTSGIKVGLGSAGTTKCGKQGTCTSLDALRDEMRALWTDHVAYTRFYLIEAIAELPEANATAARLLVNQDQIGNAIKPFYGEKAGRELSKLLRAHITGAAAVVVAARSGDAKALAAAKAAWYANADDIARFLARANPAWSFASVRQMMHVHLDQTLAEATARLDGDWQGDVRAFDAIVSHIRDMADMLADGIAKQFPDRVTTKPIAGEDLHLQLRALWEDHVMWTRDVILAATAVTSCGHPLADLDVAMARLLANQDDLGNAVRPYLGDKVADQLTVLLRAHITIAAELVTDAVSGDRTKLADARARWYANADQIAQLLSDALNVPYATMEVMMRAHLDETLAEATDHLAGRYKLDLVDYDRVVHHILGMSDELSAAILAACAP